MNFLKKKSSLNRVSKTLKHVFKQLFLGKLCRKFKEKSSMIKNLKNLLLPQVKEKKNNPNNIMIMIMMKSNQSSPKNLLNLLDLNSNKTKMMLYLCLQKLPQVFIIWKEMKKMNG